MLSDWLSEDGRKAIAKASLADADEVDYIIESYALDNDHDRIIALLRDRAREWLAERCGDWEEWMTVCWCLCSHNKIRTPYVAKGEWHDDYDAALIAAVLSQKEAGDED